MNRGYNGVARHSEFILDPGRGRKNHPKYIFTQQQVEREVAARAGGVRPNDPRITDLHCLICYAAEGAGADDLIAYAEHAAAEGGWGIFTFHGVGGDHLAVDAEAFDALTRHLARQRHRLWTATLIEVADHVRAGRHV